MAKRFSNPKSAKGSPLDDTAAELAFPLSLELRFPIHVPVVNFPMHWNFLGRPRRQGRLGILNHQFL